jgi:hypothetical protein
LLISLAISIGGRLVFFGVQALLTRRLVRKNYRTFRVGTVREVGSEAESYLCAKPAWYGSGFLDRSLR